MEVRFRGATRLAFDGSLVFQPPLRWGSALLNAPNLPVGLSLAYVPALLPFRPWAGLQPPITSLLYDQRLLYNDPIWVAISWVQPAFVAITAILIAIAVRRLGGSGRLGVVAGFTYAFATPLLHYGRSDVAQPLTALLLLATTLLALRAVDGIRDRLWLIVGVLALGVLMRPVDGALATGVGIVVALWPGRETIRDEGPGTANGGRPARFLILLMVGAASGLGLTLVINLVRHGNLLDFGYGSQGFTTPLPIGLLAYLISPGRAIVWYAPIAFLAPWGAWALVRHGSRRELVALVFPCLVWLLVYSTWLGLGAWSWGPRFMVPILPFIVILAALAVARAHVAAARLAFGLLALAGLAANATQLFVDPLQTVWGIYGDDVYPTAGFWRQFEPGAFQPLALFAFFHVDRLSHLFDVVWLRATHDTGGISLAFGLALAGTAFLATLVALRFSRAGWRGEGQDEGRA